MITASALGRLLNCPGSVVLPKAETASEWADAGHAEHAELADMVRTGTLPDSLARLVPPGSRVEVALAFDVALRTARIVGEDIGRNYGTPGAFEIVGSCDVIGIDGDAAVIVDWKTGYRDVEPAATNPQMAFYALAATRALGLDRAVVRIVYTKTGAVDAAELDALELAAFADQLERLLVRVSAQQAARNDASGVSTREGSWCRHCPVNKSHCPSKSALLVQIANGGLRVVGEPALTPERARIAYQQVVAVRSMLDDAEKRLQTWVKENGAIDLGNGQAYGYYMRNGKSKLDVDAAERAIAELTGDVAREFLAMSVKRSVSQVDIERAAKALLPKGYTKLKKQIVDRIDELGGKKQTVEYPIGEHAIAKSSLPPDVDLDEVNRLLESA